MHGWHVGKMQPHFSCARITLQLPTRTAAHVGRALAPSMWIPLPASQQEQKGSAMRCHRLSYVPPYPLPLDFAVLLLPAALEAGRRQGRAGAVCRRFRAGGLRRWALRCGAAGRRRRGAPALRPERLLQQLRLLQHLLQREQRRPGLLLLLLYGALTAPLRLLRGAAGAAREAFALLARCCRRRAGEGESGGRQGA